MARKSKPERRSKRTRRVSSRPRRPAASRKKPLRRRKRVRSSPLIEIAIREMNRGRSLPATARSLNLPSKNLQNTLKRLRLLKRKGRRWLINDDRLRRVPVITDSGIENLTVRGYKQASLVGEHHHAVGEFVRTNNPKVLKSFKGRTVRAVNGREYVLETDPNTLHRIAAVDSPPFHEIYQITSST